MFGRGNWAIFGVKADTQGAFETSLNDSKIAESVSQFHAKKDNGLTFGINPYNVPRWDEDTSFVDDLVQTENFRLGPQQFGLWFVKNDHEDITDPKSKQEALAYANITKPFKFLNKEEKKMVNERVEASAVVCRKQFPVLIDFIGERAYALTTDVDEIIALRDILTELGVQTFNLSWVFDTPDWPGKFLNAVQSANKFPTQMAARADELRRFRKEDIEKLEDKMMESIVSNFFALAELDTGYWAGLSTPAKINLFPVSEPSSETSVSTAFTLLNLVDEAWVVSANVVFQQLDSKFTKDEDEKKFRTDVLSIDLNDKANISDAGCAALRGFDLPRFKKDMKRQIKEKTSLEISNYWMEWLIEMKGAVNFFIDNINETLKLNKEENGLNPYFDDYHEASSGE